MDIAFADGAERILKDKQLKKKQKEIVQIEAEWSKAQHDVIRAKLQFMTLNLIFLQGSNRGIGSLYGKWEMF